MNNYITEPFNKGYEIIFGTQVPNWFWSITIIGGLTLGIFYLLCIIYLIKTKNG